MSYINKVIIENFQSHRYSELELDSGLNVIVGPSDQGKSAIIRAVKWVLFNEPRGNEFIRQGSTSAKVSIEMSDGLKIIREKSASKNRYTVIDTEGKSNVYEGFGNDVPEEVKKVHGIAKIVIDTDSSVSLNIGDQLEGPFLLSETGSVRAKAIGRLTGVHVLDNAIRECINDIKKEIQAKNRYIKENEAVRDKLKEYETLEPLGERIYKQEELLIKLDEFTAKYSKLQNKKMNFEEINTSKEKTVKALDEFKDVDKAELLTFKLAEKVSDFNKLNVLRISSRDIASEINIEESILKQTINLQKLNKKMEFIRNNMVAVNKLEAVRNKYQHITIETELTRQKFDKLSIMTSSESNTIKISELVIQKEKLEAMSKTKKNLEVSIRDGKNYCNKLKDELKNMVELYKKYLKKLSKCPICFNQIDEITIKKIIMQYEEGL